MAVYVLIHGGFHGGWCYDRVAGRLTAMGHHVFAPTLAGVGERFGETLEPVNLGTHVREVTALIEREALADVILAGHSYGGMVITGVASQLGARVRTLVYLDAMMPADGQSMLDLVGHVAAQRLVASAARDGLTVPPAPASAFGVNPADIEMVDRLCTGHPLACFLQAVRLTGQERLVRNLSFVTARNSRVPVSDHMRLSFENDPRWRMASIDAGHDLMIDNPAALAVLLDAEATRSA